MSSTEIMGIFIISSFSLAYLAELAAGRITNAKRPLRDALFSLSAMLSQPILTGVVVAFVASNLMVLALPTYANRFAELPFLPCFLGLFFINEMLHYWVHRAAHEYRWLWKLHRTHHSGMDMNAGLMFRYNLFWPLIVPQTWMGSVAMYLGQTDAFLLAAMITYGVNVLTHVSFRWDLWLRKKIPGLKPLWWLIERSITLPDTHQAHHAYGKGAHPNGNYAVTLFIFDVLFGTAKIPRQRQQNFGLPISPRLHWAEELLWPIIKKPLLPKAAAQTSKK